jgi:RNA polymerase sigma factor (sigma-70 family)
MLVRVATRKVGANDAEDMVQEAYIAWLEYDGEVDDPLKFLMTVLKRRCIDFKFRGRRDVPADLSNRSVANNGLRDALYSLPTVQRQVVECVDVNRMTQGECAKALDMSEPQVQRLRAKALNELSLLLGTQRAEKHP